MKEVTIQVATGTEFSFTMSHDVTQQIVDALADTTTRVIVIPATSESGAISVMKSHIVWVEVEDVR